MVDLLYYLYHTLIYVKVWTDRLHEGSHIFMLGPTKVSKIPENTEKTVILVIQGENMIL